MISKRIITAVTGSLICLICLAGIAMAGSLSDIQFIMTAANDEKATIKNPDGTLQIIQPGDVIADTYTVKRITPGGIVLENSATDGPKIVTVRVQHGKQRIVPFVNNKQQADQLKASQSGPPAAATPAPARRKNGPFSLEHPIG